MARKYQDIRSRAATEADGILNYGRRLDPLKERFDADFRNALARLTAVRQGLKDLYGYEEPFPDDETAIDFFDDCLLWTRAAIQFLIRFSRADQSLILPISLRQFLGDGAYRRGRRSGKWELRLKGAVFDSMFHLRLRGLSAFVVGGDAENKLWHLVISVPRSGEVNHLTGKQVLMDQSGIPPCHLTRVAGRHVQREPDIGGIASLYNVSPIGEWVLQIVSSVPSEDLDKLRDVQLDLNLAYRSPRGMSYQQ